MYDNLPFKSRDKCVINAFISSGKLKLFDEKITYCKKTGLQFTNKRFYKYFNLIFVFDYLSKDVIKEVSCKGSFHYLINEGVHNANRVNFVEASAMLNNFADEFNVDLSKLILRPPEFAVLINPEFNINEIIDYTFYESRKRFNCNPSHISTSKLSGKPTDNYRLKSYNKYIEHPLHCQSNTLKFEYKFIRVRRLFNKNIKTMADLLILENWVVIRDIHLEHFKQLVIYDFTIELPKKASQVLINKLKNYSNQKYWKDLVRDCKNGSCAEKQYNKKLNDLNKLSKKYGSNLKEYLIELVEKEWEYFLKMDTDAQH